MNDLGIRQETAQGGFDEIGKASNKTDPTAVLLSYPTALLAANKPDEAWRVPGGSGMSNRMTFRFLLGKATSVDGKTTDIYFWFYDDDNSPVHVATLQVTAGTAVMTDHPVDGKTLPDTSPATYQWAYADAISETYVSSGVELYYRGNPDQNGIVEVAFDIWGAKEIYPDIVCTDAAGTAVDAIVLGRPW